MYTDDQPEQQWVRTLSWLFMTVFACVFIYIVLNICILIVEDAYFAASREKEKAEAQNSDCLSFSEGKAASAVAGSHSRDASVEIGRLQDALRDATARYEAAEALLQVLRDTPGAGSALYST